MKAYRDVFNLTSEWCGREHSYGSDHGGLFVAMPSRRTTEGELRDVAHSITAHARETISETALNSFGGMAPATHNW